MRTNISIRHSLSSRQSLRLLVLALLLFYPQIARGLDFDGLPYVQYGDAQSYSLPISQFLTGCTGPGCPYYVGSTPGLIQDLVVVATGTSSNPTTTNFAGMDNAYPTPSGVSGSTFFSTGTVADPGQVGGSFTGDQANTWDSTLLALKTFLNNQTLVFFFNNNQTNSGSAADQNLAAWGQVTITDNNNNVVGTYDFTNMGGEYKGTFEGGGGIFNGNVANYTSTGAGPTGDASGSPTDYVLSGGQVCLNAANNPVSCSDPTAVETINHNLGANEAAYALIFPELNAQLAALFSNLALDLSQYTLHIDLRLGCDPTLFTTSAACLGKDLNNGYEQLFIARLETVPTGVPEPASLLLFGFGLLGLAAWKKHRSA